MRVGIFCVLFTYIVPDSPVERIANQKFAVKILTLLYRHSTEWAENPDSGVEKHSGINPTRFVKQALKGVRFAATTTTTALGNVASEIAGRCAHLVPLQPENQNIQTMNFISSVLQPNSPQAMVLTALESAHKTKLVRIANASMSVLAIIVVWILARTSYILFLPRPGQGLFGLSGYLPFFSFFRGSRFCFCVI
jgi:hypothetical protein